ncbi:MAG: type II toxin-antitoxin system RelE/ParE family toxin [Acidobacteria bacterium]|nr:type II toxin-antitoxin system RelE/ParE family toxin [Acidobacteriota bacterium]
MSGKPVEFHPEALAEAEAALAWYQERSLRAAEVFVRELEKGIDALSDAPHRWPQYEHGCRRYPLLRMPYLLIYRETAASIQVLAVAHGRRRPGYWRVRATE